MPAPARVIELVQTFDRNLEAYRSDRYNETQLRREFVDPFFKALGWDVDNEQGYAEPYKDVIHEDAIRVGGATKGARRRHLLRPTGAHREGERTLSGGSRHRIRSYPPFWPGKGARGDSKRRSPCGT